MLLILFTTFSLSVLCDQFYTRKELYKKYPGYGKEWIFFPDGNGTPQKMYLVERDNFPIKAIDFNKIIGFHLYTRSNANVSYQLEIDNLEILKNSPFDHRKKVKFITHGWMADSESESCQLIKNAYLKSFDYNVIIVDWKIIANNAFYLIPKQNSKQVGDIFAKMIEFLVRNAKVPLTNIHLIGHSLGAHISGFAGANLSCGKIARITALDAALPGFLLLAQPEDKLDSTDAFYVDAIHTCAGALGFYSALGNADFYPNGGTPVQPGCCCIAEFTEACSHGRAYKYFAESIAIPSGFIGLKCDSWLDYKSDNCQGEYAIMGEFTSTAAQAFVKLSCDPNGLKRTNDMEAECFFGPTCPPLRIFDSHFAPAFDRALIDLCNPIN